MEELIAENHKFNSADWPGGDTSNPEFISTPAVQTFKTNAAAAPPTNDWLAAKIREHDIALAQLQSENCRLKQKLRKRHRKPGCKLTSMTPKIRKTKAKVSQVTTGSQPYEDNHLPDYSVANLHQNRKHHLQVHRLSDRPAKQHMLKCNRKPQALSHRKTPTFRTATVQARHRNHRQQR
ncbi:hypothetical protein Bca52824_064046 [Brassica carinata]|uniref:Uncharacterized protein n=1 Tax=Brassica carinata TaxID=52824 RepID=A0A8X7U9S3_BRACI|nr:hypothetical protein Bca52824_064046 [Brassica carinata]